MTVARRFVTAARVVASRRAVTGRGERRQLPGPPEPSMPN